MRSRNFTAAVLLEAVMVVAAAAVFALVANQLSPRGLHLARDYFPHVTAPTNPPPKVLPSAPSVAVATNEDSEAAATNDRIKDKGLQPIDRADVERLFHDPRYQQGLLVFIDARGEDHYAESHIPGAYQLDHYQKKNLAPVLDACQNAEQVVVYCTGGECEDAEYTAVDLRDSKVPNPKIFVYGGGFDDWSAHHLPLEKGERNSGLTPAESK